MLVATVIQAPTRGCDSAATLSGFVVALLALAGFIGWEAHRVDPLLDVWLFTNARFFAASAAIALAFFGLFGFIFLTTLYFQAVCGYSPLRAGVATVPFALVTGALSPVAIIAMKRLDTKIVAATGLWRRT